MSGFKEYDHYDGLGLAELVKKKEITHRKIEFICKYGNYSFIGIKLCRDSASTNRYHGLCHW